MISSGMGTGARRVTVAALLLRLGLAALFLSFGLDKFARPANIQRQVVDSQLLSDALARLFASAIGFWEVGLGVLFLLGLFTRPAALVAILALIGYTIYLGVASQYPIFGVSQLGVVDRNVPLMFMSGALLVVGAGAWSLDRALGRRRPRRSLDSLPEDDFASDGVDLRPI
jgi:putative oxidoreductase